MSYKIYELGHMLGLKNKDIQNILSDNFILDTSVNKWIPFFTVSEYGKGSMYGTPSMKDF